MATNRKKSSAKTKSKVSQARKRKPSSPPTHRDGGIGPNYQLAENGLTLQQWKFIDAYLNEAGGNATRAARIAGYGSTYASSSVAGHSLVNHPKIARLIKEQLEHHGMSATQTVYNLAQLANVSVGDFFKLNEDGSIVVKNGQPVIDFNRAKQEGRLHLVQEITLNADGSIKIKLPNKLEANIAFLKYHGLLRDQIDVTIKSDGDQIKREILAKLASAVQKMSQADQDILRSATSGRLGQAQIEHSAGGSPTARAGEGGESGHPTKGQGEGQEIEV
jgi:phage terminase small subunit